MGYIFDLLSPRGTAARDNWPQMKILEHGVNNHASLVVFRPEPHGESPSEHQGEGDIDMTQPNVTKMTQNAHASQDVKQEGEGSKRS